MKKILTLLFAFGITTATFAQNSGNHYGWDKQKDKDKHGKKHNHRHDDKGRYNDDRYDRRYNGRDNTNTREMQLKLDEINRAYDRRVQNIQNKPFMSRSKKQREVNELEAQRRQELNAVYARYNVRNNQYDNRSANNKWW